MSTKNFISYGDAETLFTGVGNKISGKQAKPTTISYADWLLLTPQQQETGNWLVTGVPGADLSLRVLALETNKQDKTDNNLQTTSKETTGAINELKSGLIKSLTTQTTITTDSNGTGESATIASLHPNKTILGVIVGYNYQTSYGAHHAVNIGYYPTNDTILIANDALTEVEISVFYTLLYRD